jgi:hypothetical protein
MFKPIVRCVATHANPDTGERDMETVDLLRRHFGRDTMGCYYAVEQGGRVARGDDALFA